MGNIVIFAVIKIMRTRLITLVLCCLCLAAFGQQVNRDDARLIAEQFAQGKGLAFTSPTVSVPGKIGLSHVYSGTATDTEQDAAYYVFNIGEDGGFVIVSGDKRTEQVLGYSDTGNFDWDALPVNMRAWLDEVAAQISYLRSNDLPSQRRASASADEPVMPFIAPMVTTMWNQSAPYNNKCPLYNNKRSVTGCVATAMAQVLYYHRENNPGYILQDIPSYYTRTDEMLVDGIAAGTMLDWGNMLNSYNGSYTTTQSDAVATLMLCCGVAVEMRYTSSSSGAYSADVPDALKTYFGFNDATMIRSRGTAGAEEWDKLLYNELALNRPVYYSGSSTGGAHAFVIDGFDGKGLFHVNWGWGGKSNGYFLISVLNPGDNTGIGASSTTDGYSMSQYAVFNAQPRTVDVVVTPYQKRLTSTALPIEDGQVGFSFFNKTGEKGNYNRGVGVIKADGTIAVLKSKGVYNDLFSGTGWSNSRFTISRSDLASAGLSYGTHELLPVSWLDTDAQWIVCERSNANRVYADYQRTSLSFNFVSASSMLSIKDVDVTNVQDATATQTVKFKLCNNGDVDFVGTIYLTATRSSDNSYTSTSRTGVAVRAKTETEISLTFKPAGEDTYTVAISTDADAENVIDKITRMLTSGTIVTNTGLSAVSTTIENMENRVLYGSRAKATVTFSNNNSLPFDGDIRIALYKNLHTGYYGKVTDQYVHAYIPSNGRSSVTVTFDDLIIEEDYWLLYYYPSVSSRFGASSTFTTAKAIMQYGANGSLAVSKPTSNFTVNDDALAVCLNGCGVTSITPNANPNTVYYINSSDPVPAGLSGRNVVKDDAAASLHLIDGYDYYFPISFTADEATYRRTPSILHDGEKGWELLSVPFSVTKIQREIDSSPIEWFHSAREHDKQMYLLEWITYDGAANALIFDYAQTLDANRPYLIGWPSALFGTSGSGNNNTIIFHGTDALIEKDGLHSAHSVDFNLVSTQQTTAVETGLVLNSNGTAFQRYTETMSVPAFRAYIAETTRCKSETDKLNIVAPHNTITNITDINQNGKSDSPWYNLQGQRVKPNGKGIYLHNGQKVIVK